MRKHSLCILFLAIFTFVLGAKLITHPTPFFDWDESIYAQVGREMVQQKSFVPLWQGQVWLDKPPLAPLTYGIVESIIPVSPEVSTRVFTLLLSVIALGLIYCFYYKITRNAVISTFTIILTAFTTVFLQRSQVLNVDVFLLLGWSGYVLFYEHFFLGLLFLGIGVLSKSLLGYYPPFMIVGVYTFLRMIGKVDNTKYHSILKKIILQMGIVTLWYVGMFAAYGKEFWKYHFVESHLKRVTASIESHFGKKTFYIDTLLDQFQILSVFIVTGTLYALWLFKHKFEKKYFLILLFVPWFIFLNLTKTKIAWYIYPVIPQFAFLITFSLVIFRKNTFIYAGGILLLLICIYTQFIAKSNILTTYYSSLEPYHTAAIYAKNTCSGPLIVYVDDDTRKTHDVLAGMNLLISTSEWWGSHPSIVYYYGKKVDFIYSRDMFHTNLQHLQANQCVLVEKRNMNEIAKSLNLYKIKQFDPYYLYKTVSTL